MDWLNTWGQGVSAKGLISIVVHCLVVIWTLHFYCQGTKNLKNTNILNTVIRIVIQTHKYARKKTQNTQKRVQLNYIHSMQIHALDMLTQTYSMYAYIHGLCGGSRNSAVVILEYCPCWVIKR